MTLSTPTTLTSGGASAATSHTTASVSSTADALLLLTVHLYASSGSTQPTVPSVSGLGRTWTQIGTDIIVDASGADRGTLFVFRAMGAAATGQVTITPPSSMKASWILDQITGAVTTGVEGADAIVASSFVKSEVASVTSVSTTSPTMASANNLLYGGVGCQNTGTKTWNNSWTRSVEITTNSITYVGTGYFLGNTQLVQNVTWTTAGRTGAFALEIAEGIPPAVTATATGIPEATSPPFGTPGTIAGVEPESHAHNPVLLAPNGNLYRLMESDLASGNHPMMMKSSDDGHTWAEVDSGNRPGAVDLEGTWTAIDGTTIQVAITRDDTVWWIPFNTSADTWGTQEVIDTGLSTNGVEQYISFEEIGDGTQWIFYSDALAGTNNQIVYRSRNATNSYSSKIDVGGNTAVDYTAPVIVRDPFAETTYVFYKDNTNGNLLKRTLSDLGTLSAVSTVVATSADAIPHTRAVFYRSGATSIVAVAYTNASDILRLAWYSAGTLQATEQISSSAITMNPANVTNGGAVAHLCLDGTTIYAVWSDAATGDILMRSRADGGTWSAITTIWDSGSNAAWYTYGNIVSRTDGSVALGVAWDVTHAVDVADIRYWELPLRGGQVGQPTATISSSNPSPTGIASAEAFGTPARSGLLTSTPTGITSAEALGTPVASQLLTLSPIGILSGEGFGTATAAKVLTSSPSSIASAEAFGSATANVVITVAPVGIASVEALGSPTAVTGSQVVPNSILSGEASGVPAANLTLTSIPSGIGSNEAFGTVVASSTLISISSGIASNEALGSPSTTSALTSSPTGIASTENFNAPVVSGFLTAASAGISSGEVFGSPVVVTVGSSTPTAIPSAEAFGTPTHSGILIASPVGFEASVVGTPTATTLLVVNVDGTVTQEAFGTPGVSSGVVAAAAGISSDESFGVVTASTTLTAIVSSISSLEAFGIAVATGAVTVAPIGITSVETFGVPFVISDATYLPVGIVAGEAFGSVLAIIGEDIPPDYEATIKLVTYGVVEEVNVGVVPARRNTGRTLDGI